MAAVNESMCTCTTNEMPDTSLKKYIKTDEERGNTHTHLVSNGSLPKDKYLLPFALSQIAGREETQSKPTLLPTETTVSISVLKKKGNHGKDALENDVHSDQQ